MNFFIPILFIAISYLMGSIPVGYLVGRLYGIDVTASGSGRTGGTNLLRSAGGLAAGLTVMGDAGKGLLPIYLISIWGYVTGDHLTPALCAAATVIGHNHSIFLGFRGGVGAGTAVGSVGGLNFWVGLTLVFTSLTVLAISRYASVMSASVALFSLLLLAGSAWLGYTPYEYIITGLINIVVIFYALRGNFARLRAGTERKVGQKAEKIAKV